MLFQLNPSTGEPYYPLPAPFQSFRLTPLRESDTPDIIEILNDPAVSPYKTTPLPYTLEDAQRFMERTVGPQDAAWAEIKEASQVVRESEYDYQGIPSNGACPVRILREVSTNPDGSESEKFAGNFWFMRNTFWEIEDDLERARLIAENEGKETGDPSVVWSFGYFLDPAFHGRGLMSKLLGTMLSDWAVPHLHARHIVALTASNNIGSQKVMLKNQMKYMGKVKAPEVIAVVMRRKGVEDDMICVLEWRADV